MGIRVRSPQGGMFKLVGNWSGETIGQDYAGRGRMLVWLEPDDAMARVEPEDAAPPRTQEHIAPAAPPQLPERT